MSSDEEYFPRKIQRLAEVSYSSTVSSEEDANPDQNTCELVDDNCTKQASDCLLNITSVLDKGFHNELQLVKASVSQDKTFESITDQSLDVSNDDNIPTSNSQSPNSSFIANGSLDVHETPLPDPNHDELVERVMLMADDVLHSHNLDSTNEDKDQKDESYDLDISREEKDENYELDCSNEVNKDASILLKHIDEDVESAVLSIQNETSMVVADSSRGCDGKDESVLHSSLVFNDLNSSIVSEEVEELLGTRRLQDTDYASTPHKLATLPSLSQPYLPKVSPIKFEECYSPTNEHSTENHSETNSESESDNQEESLLDSIKKDSGESDVETYEMCETLLEGKMSQLLEDNLLNESSASIHEPVKTISERFLMNDIKLYNGSSKSVNEGILEIMILYLQNKLSKAGLHRTIRSMCDLLPEDHKLPSSSYSMLSYIQSLAPPVSATLHYFCESCLYYHGTSTDGQCAICKADTNFGRFYTLCILIKFFFENRNLASLIDSESERRKNRNVNTLTDLKDGTVYQSLLRFRRHYDLTLIFNSDGVRIRKSKKELWLAMVTIAELPIHLQKSFLTVIGVWYHEKHPDMKTFLKPFVDSMECLHENGAEWTHPTTGDVEKSRVRLAVTVLDAPARASVQNIMNHNSRYGCNICEIKTQRSQFVPGKRCVRVYHYAPGSTLRTKERMLKQAEMVLEQGKVHIRGVKGPSILRLIPNVDESECIVPEYLHSVLIGVVKQVIVYWTTSTGRGSIKGRISVIDCFLSTFKHPDFIHRSVRQLRNLKDWKASDFYYFMLFEALPALQGHLSDAYLQHFMLLVKAIFTLLKSSITRSELDEADILLKLFVNEFMSLYGDRAMTYNVHQLTYLVMCCRKFGPLFCWSAFPFEDLNGMVAKSTHGTYNVDAEIVNNIRICQGIQMLQNIVRGHHGLDVPCSSYSKGEFVGQSESSFALSPEDKNILQDSSPIIYARAKLSYDTYTSEIYKTLNTENFHVTFTQNEIPMYGSIRYFAKCKYDDFAVIRLFKVDHMSVFYHKRTLKCIEQFIPVHASNQYVAVKLKDIASSIVKVGKINQYIYRRPHLYRFVL